MNEKFEELKTNYKEKLKKIDDEYLKEIDKLQKEKNDLKIIKNDLYINEDKEWNMMNQIKLLEKEYEDKSKRYLDDKIKINVKRNTLINQIKADHEVIKQDTKVLKTKENEVLKLKRLFEEEKEEYEKHFNYLKDENEIYMKQFNEKKPQLKVLNEEIIQQQSQYHYHINKISDLKKDLKNMIDVLPYKIEKLLDSNEKIKQENKDIELRIENKKKKLADSIKIKEKECIQLRQNIQLILDQRHEVEIILLDSIKREISQRKNNNNEKLVEDLNIECSKITWNERENILTNIIESLNNNMNKEDIIFWRELNVSNLIAELMKYVK